MTEVWLQSNRRILLLAVAPVVVLGGLGWAIFRGEGLPLPVWLGAGCLGFALMLLVGLVRQFFQPRIAYRDASVLFYLKAGGPIVVPVDVVEAFFQGEGPAHLPGASQDQTKSVNLIARLAQRETDWQQRDVKAALGNWAEGYVTMRGTWCEPITMEVIGRLNRRLAQVKAEEQTQTEGSTEGATEE
ncbi:MAG: hypothetical protein GXP24_09245 [Planctomycetes bacterium]|nr:hypothetical protein [Planctomycetota bacterium]